MAEKGRPITIWLSAEQLEYFINKWGRFDSPTIKAHLRKDFPDMPEDGRVGNAVAVIVDDIEYESMQAAADIRGVSRQAIQQQLKRAKKRKNKLIGS